MEVVNVLMKSFIETVGLRVGSTDGKRVGLKVKAEGFAGRDRFDGGDVGRTDGCLDGNLLGTARG
jgi:hypothetical protein